MRFLIASKSVPSHYQGMDRPLLGMRNDVSDDMIVRGMALEDLPPNKAEAGYRNFVAELGERQQLGLSEPLLNSYGLFPNRADAQRFLRAYLEHDDPDRGWSADGWQEQTDIYAVIPIYRLRKT